MPQSPREKLLVTAARLFSKNGYHATGVDRIIAESGVSKMTLYKHFGSKDELILAALRRWDEQSRLWLMRAMESRASAPRERLLALFAVLDEWFVSQDFYGCLFINATAEYADPEDPVHAAAVEHKRLFRQHLESLAEAAGARDPGELTHQLSLLMEGAIVMAQVSNAPGCGARAGEAARIIIDSALAKVVTVH